mmetsp:Transcript_8296/g.15246  ORF Transcript_8296/g.15246 Transcript_8296/m.15246 type:complete len:204 (+) Transcript_8296:1351-1962(+)
MTLLPKTSTSRRNVSGPDIQSRARCCSSDSSTDFGSATRFVSAFTHGTALSAAEKLMRCEASSASRAAAAAARRSWRRAAASSSTRAAASAARLAAAASALRRCSAARRCALRSFSSRRPAAAKSRSISTFCESALRSAKALCCVACLVRCSVWCLPDVGSNMGERTSLSKVSGPLDSASNLLCFLNSSVVKGRKGLSRWGLA